MDLVMLILVGVIGLFAGTYGAIIGSSLLIVVPALMLLGLPAHIALGTGKISALFRDVPALINYEEAHKVKHHIVIPFTIFAVIFTIIGSFITLSLNEAVLRKIISFFMIFIGAFILANPKLGLNPKKIKFNRKSRMLSSFLGILIGFYAGIYGGGASSLMIFSFVIVLGLDFLGASASSKIPNMLTIFVFLVIFALYRKIDYIVAIPLVIGMTIGGYVGSKIAIKEGNKFIRWLFVFIIFVMAIKLLFFS